MSIRESSCLDRDSWPASENVSETVQVDRLICHHFMLNQTNSLVVSYYKNPPNCNHVENSCNC